MQLGCETAPSVSQDILHSPSLSALPLASHLLTPLSFLTRLSAAYPAAQLSLNCSQASGAHFRQEVIPNESNFFD